eukprot:Lankesteria_metandrocarpae@DN7443_c0_g1_i1.p1
MALHNSLLGSNTLRGGTKGYDSNVLGASDNWFENRLDPRRQRAAQLRRDYATRARSNAPTKRVESSTSSPLHEFNRSGRCDLDLLNTRDYNKHHPLGGPYRSVATNTGGMSPNGTASNHDTYHTVYSETIGMHPYWKEKPFKVDMAGNIFQYQEYKPDNHWKTTNMTHYRYNRPTYVPAHHDYRYTRNNREDELNTQYDNEDPYRPCYLSDKHIGRKHDKSTMTRLDDPEFPPLKVPEAVQDACAREAVHVYPIDDSHLTTPVQPQWIREADVGYSTYVPPPSWPPPWRDSPLRGARRGAVPHAPNEGGGVDHMCPPHHDDDQPIINASRTTDKHRRTIKHKDRRVCIAPVNAGTQTPPTEDNKVPLHNDNRHGGRRHGKGRQHVPVHTNDGDIIIPVRSKLRAAPPVCGYAGHKRLDER